MAKQTMGKDDSGTFHPGKGKPSGINKEEGLGIQATPYEKMNEYIEISENIQSARMNWIPPYHFGTATATHPKAKTRTKAKKIKTRAIRATTKPLLKSEPRRKLSSYPVF